MSRNIRGWLARAMRTRRLSHLLTALLAAIAAAGLTIIISPGEDGRPSVTIRVGQATVPAESVVDASARPGVQPVTVTAPTDAVVQAAQSPELSQPGGLRSETPPGVTSAQLEASRVKQEALAQTDQLPLVAPDAAPSQAGCASRFVRNYSTRRGVRPREWVLHYTVTPNRPGWGDVDAITSFFNSRGSYASSNYVIDSEGHCAYIVRETDKAWTQAGGNPYSISVEVIATGREKRYLEPAGLRKLARVISDSARRWQIPIRAGRVNGCVPVTPGIIDHRAWGPCGGGHVDITPFTVATVIRAVRAYRAATSSAARLRRDHARTHTQIRAKCHGAAARTHRVVCPRLRQRNLRLHAQARRQKVTLR